MVQIVVLSFIRTAMAAALVWWVGSLHTIIRENYDLSTTETVASFVAMIAIAIYGFETLVSRNVSRIAGTRWACKRITPLWYQQKLWWEFARRTEKSLEKQKDNPFVYLAYLKLYSANHRIGDGFWAAYDELMKETEPRTQAQMDSEMLRNPPYELGGTVEVGWGDRDVVKRNGWFGGA